MIFLEVSSSLHSFLRKCLQNAHIWKTLSVSQSDRQTDKGSSYSLQIHKDAFSADDYHTAEPTEVPYTFRYFYTVAQSIKKNTQGSRCNKIDNLH